MEYSLRITVITENSVTRRNLLAEHGLSLLVETEGYKLLFDTGQGLAITPNIKALQVDLTQINAIALSHGHNDHTGGLQQALAFSGPKPIYAHPGIFDEKYSVNAEGEHVPNGIPFKQSELRLWGQKFTSQPSQLF